MKSFKYCLVASIIVSIAWTVIQLVVTYLSVGSPFGVAATISAIVFYTVDWLPFIFCEGLLKKMGFIDGNVIGYSSFVLITVVRVMLILPLVYLVVHRSKIRKRTILIGTLPVFLLYGIGYVVCRQSKLIIHSTMGDGENITLHDVTAGDFKFSPAPVLTFLYTPLRYVELAYWHIAKPVGSSEMSKPPFYDPNNNNFDPRSIYFGSNTINIVKGRYAPTEINIKKGETVTWQSSDTSDNRNAVESEQGASQEFSSPILKSGDRFAYTFSQSGIFRWRDKYNPRLRGIITVTD